MFTKISLAKQLMMNLFLALLLTAVVSQPVNLELENKKADLGSQLSAAALELFMKFDVLIEEYTCKLEDADCKPWKADNLLDAMQLKKVNCDEDTDKTNEMCAKARELLGNMEANNEAIQEGLKDIARQMFNKETKAVMNPLGGAIADFICYKEEGLCEILRAIYDAEEQIENKYEDENKK
ncbi:uncharacterized protein LOC134824458 [Bolinopsis microptera]|uniref:uncharacterized protein LOC134824458 n=1 Tax=Bolinopsis microptera TaxID=2820187 RepID=UPI00307AC3CA